MTDDGTDKQQTTDANGGSQTPQQSTGRSTGRSMGQSQSTGQGSEQGSSQDTAQTTQSTVHSTGPSSSDATTNASAHTHPASTTAELRTLWHDALGNLSERQLLRALAATQVSGTLWLERPHHCSLLLLANGRTLVSFELANTPKSHRRVRLFAHPSDETTLLPRATSRYPESHLPLLQALPDLPPEQHITTASCDLNGLVQEQTEGLLVVETIPLDDTQPPHKQFPRTKRQRGYALFVAGELRDVSLERWSDSTDSSDREVYEGSDALTALLEIAGHVTVSQWALAPFVSAGLLALRGERRNDSPPFLRLRTTKDTLVEKTTVDEAFDADAVILAQAGDVATDEALEPAPNFADDNNTHNPENLEDTADLDTTDLDTQTLTPQMTHTQHHQQHVKALTRMRFRMRSR